MDKARDAFRTISEVAKWLDTPAHVLRFWESKFTQVKPVKRAGGRRYYRPTDMMLLSGIKKLLHDDGVTIKGVQKILREQGVKSVSALSQPLDDDTPIPKAEDKVVPFVEPAIDEVAPQASDAEPSEKIVPLHTPAEPEASDPLPPVEEPEETVAQPINDTVESAPEVSVEGTAEATPQEADVTSEETAAPEVSDHVEAAQDVEPVPPEDIDQTVGEEEVPADAAVSEALTKPEPADSSDENPQAEVADAESDEISGGADETELASADETDSLSEEMDSPKVAQVDVPADPEDEDTLSPSGITAQMLRSADLAALSARKDELAPLYQRLVTLRERMGS